MAEKYETPEHWEIHYDFVTDSRSMSQERIATWDTDKQEWEAKDLDGVTQHRFRKGGSPVGGRHIRSIYVGPQDLKSGLGPPGKRFVEDTEFVVDSETGGMKGQKLARFDMIPQDVLWELATHFGKGEGKYPSDPETGEANWKKGYKYSLSSAALMRHLSLFLQGEDVDEETGSSHLIAVMWHAAAMRWFQLHERGTDDRPKP